jgi:DNA-binding transcriptional regulator YiaG
METHLTPKQIKALRESLGQDQAAFGETIGVSRSWACKLENGNKKPTKTMIKLLKLLKEKNSK